MKKKGKLLRSLAVLLLVMVCAALNPKIAKAAAENITMKNAKMIKIGDEVNGTYKDKDKKHECRYYKFKVPTDIGNKWIDFKLRNNLNIDCEMKLYNDNEEELTSIWNIGENKTDKMHLSVAESEHNNDIKKLTPGKTYYLGIIADNWYADYSKDFVLSSSTVEDDNWGSNEKATEVKKYDIWGKGVLEYTDDVDRYCFKLPKDKKKYIIKLWADEDISVTLEDELGVKIDSYNLWKNETVNGFEVIGNGKKVHIKFEAGSFPSWSRDVHYKYMISSPKQVVKKKTISILKVSKCKKGMKVVKGKTISKANVKVTVNGKAYKTVKSNAKGNFAVKTKKLKTGQKIKVTVSKSGYKTRTSGTIKVKKK